MIRSLYGSFVGDFFDMRDDIFWYSEIIQSPSDIPRSCTSSEWSPRILVFLIRIEISEYIDISCLFQLIHFRPFYRKESDVMFIFLWSCDIYLCMADIEITAGDDFFSLISELIDIIPEVLVEFQFIVQHLRSISPFSSIRKIDIQQREFLKLRLDHPSFFMKMLHRLKPRCSRNKMQAFLIQGSDTGISRLFSGMPYPLIIS